MVVNRITMPPTQPITKRLFLNRKMATDFPSDNTNGNDIATTMMNFKNNLAPRAVTVTTTSQLQSNSQTSTTTTRVAKSSVSSSSTTSSSQRVHHLTTTSSTDRKASSMKSDLNELKNNMNEMKNLSNINALKKLRSSLENLVDTEDNDISEPLVTFPDPDTPPPSSDLVSSSTNNLDTVKFEQKTVNNFKTSKVVKDGFSAEKASANCAEVKRVQAGEMSYQENSAAGASHARLEIDGVSAEKVMYTQRKPDP